MDPQQDTRKTPLSSPENKKEENLSTQIASVSQSNNESPVVKPVAVAPAWDDDDDWLGGGSSCRRMM